MNYDKIQALRCKWWLFPFVAWKYRNSILGAASEIETSNKANGIMRLQLEELTADNKTMSEDNHLMQVELSSLRDKYADLEKQYIQAKTGIVKLLQFIHITHRLSGSFSENEVLKAISGRG